MQTNILNWAAWKAVSLAIVAYGFFALWQCAAFGHWHMAPAFITIVCAVLVFRVWQVEGYELTMLLLALWGLSPVVLAAWLWWALASI